jgi:pimeloyl-ACP methyl ester carboxylesterase
VVHGLVVSSRYIVPTAERLAPHYQVFVPNLPGFGRSKSPPRVLDVAGLSPTPSRDGWERSGVSERRKRSRIPPEQQIFRSLDQPPSRGIACGLGLNRGRFASRAR